jgi:hypothetical protein
METLMLSSRAEGVNDARTIFLYARREIGSWFIADSVGEEC